MSLDDIQLPRISVKACAADTAGPQSTAAHRLQTTTLVWANQKKGDESMKDGFGSQDFKLTLMKVN